MRPVVALAARDRAACAPRALLVALATVGLWLALPAGRAAATSRGNVVLVRSPSADAVAVEVMNRVRGELAAAGFEVVTSDAQPGQLAREAVETAGAAFHPVGAFELLFERDEHGNIVAAELWVSDRIASRTVVERTLLGPSNAGKRGSVLAVRAVELLRASLAPSVGSPASSALSSTREERQPEARPDAPARPQRAAFSAALGAAWLAHAVGPAALWQGVARLAWRRWSAWEPELALLFPLSPAESAGVGGAARVSFTGASAGAVRLFRADQSVNPFLGARLGLLRVSVRGEPAPTFEAQSPTAWTGEGVLGLGVAFRLTAHVAWRMALELDVAWPRADVQIGGPGDAIAWPAARVLGACEVRL